MFGSDPYVDIETTDQDIRSSIIYNTVNPEWNESFDIVVYDRGSQVISFTVFDFDMANNTKCLGKAEFEVNKVPFNTTVQKALHLTGVAKGSLVVSCTYIPMSSAHKTIDWREEMKRFYVAIGLPEKIAGINTILNTWAGKEEQMISSLMEKYRASIPAQMSTHLESLLAHHETHSESSFVRGPPINSGTLPPPPVSSSPRSPPRSARRNKL